MTVVALDTSLSMSAPGQFEKARQLARQAIDKAQSARLSGRHVCRLRRTVRSQPSSDRAAGARRHRSRTPRRSAPRAIAPRSTRRRIFSRTPRHDRRRHRPPGERMGRRRSGGGAFDRTPSRSRMSARRRKILRSTVVLRDRTIVSSQPCAIRAPSARQAHVTLNVMPSTDGTAGGESRGDHDSGRGAAVGRRHLRRAARPMGQRSRRR